MLFQVLELFPYIVWKIVGKFQQKAAVGSAVFKMTFKFRQDVLSLIPEGDGGDRRPKACENSDAL